MPIRAVLWDVDDTLFDYTGSDDAAALAHIEAEGLLSRHASPEAALARWRTVMEEQYARFTSGEIAFLDHRRERARQFLGQRLSDEDADAWFGRYVTRYEAAWTLFPDTVAALDALAHSHRHGVLSNSSVRNQERKLTRLGIRDRFEVLLCSDRLGVAKPDPAAFLAGCAALDLPPHEVAYVGDRLDLDAEAAVAAGLTGVWLDRNGGTAAAFSPRISVLTDLPAVLEAASPSP
ncbi:HAD family hydrolase [Streptomyces sp. DSM 42041]|uniref:HAD family hydrolase n=1 Tax=Streptomyces hazeniae TaxID=3075538 RepID=A0ABU2NNY7_9ACTN|nr:HAD family hydrolase [Streptomyces sp. DSM 42041]MDT0378689.1 HAD family hydrolase [Streptomyces sp. DSM 42041]